MGGKQWQEELKRLAKANEAVLKDEQTHNVALNHCQRILIENVTYTNIRQAALSLNIGHS